MSLKSEDARALDQLRQRLSNLNAFLDTMITRFNKEQPLLDWPSIESYQKSLAHTLDQLNETMVTHEKLFKEAHVYPLSTFPGHTQEAALNQILSKKLQPPAEAWVEELTTKAEKTKGAKEGGSVGNDEMNSLWSWANSASQSIVGPMLENQDFDTDFTLAEMEDGVENVKTGLRRKMWDDESGDEDDEAADEMDEDKVSESKVEAEERIDPTLPPLPLEAVMRFMTTGAMPSRPNR